MNKKHLYLYALSLFCIVSHTLIGDEPKGESSIKVKKISYQILRNPCVTGLSLEYAITKEQREWGLMQRKELPQNHGMVFYLSGNGKPLFHMFNCYLHLSIAFLDERKVFQEFYELQAYPEKMDPRRPVISYEDLSMYPSQDAILKFFQSKGVIPHYPAKFALEMASGWFSSRGVKAGDIGVWEKHMLNPYISHTFDVSLLDIKDLPTLIELPGQFIHAVWLPNSLEDRDVVFLNLEGVVLQAAKVRGSRQYSISKKHVIYHPAPTKYLLVAPSGWIQKQSIKIGATLNFTFSEDSPLDF